ncbi:hypothetical protein [Actinomadura sp. 9N215]|uniref:hypothetical protein n=1 Tax=Actinomadura sp. 9N215 TaxID=3375150 RepID=UPI0037BBC7CD
MALTLVRTPAQAVLIDGQEPHPPARPPRAALDLYRQATDLMKDDVLPAAARLTRANAAALDHTYGARRGAAQHTAVAIAALGLALLATLLALQVLFTRRTHRMVNPSVATASALVVAFTVAGTVLFAAEAEQLRVAKEDAFDSVLALTQARAIGYDANADESRFLVDPERSSRYEQAFLDKSQQLARLPRATLTTYDGRLADAIQRYRNDHADLVFDGLYGRAFRNITFPGERERAERTIALYQQYERDDRHLRALAAKGNLRAAVEFNTSYAVGGSNHDFTAYDRSLESLIALNHQHFDASIRDGRRALRGWSYIPALAVVVCTVLIVTGVRPRLVEYRA